MLIVTPFGVENGNKNCVPCPASVRVKLAVAEIDGVIVALDKNRTGVAWHNRSTNSISRDMPFIAVRAANWSTGRDVMDNGRRHTAVGLSDAANDEITTGMLTDTERRKIIIRFLILINCR